MRISRLFFVLGILACFHAPAGAQVNTWRSYTDMQDIRSLNPVASGIWAATGGGLFFYDFASQSYRQFTNIEGLGATDYTAVLALDSSTIVAGASNGIINIRGADGEWIVAPDIARATDKPQRGITFLRWYGNRLFIGTEFGLSQFDVTSREFKETYVKFGDLPALVTTTGMLVRNDSLWVTTLKGVAVASLKSTNLQDPSRWRTFTTVDGLSSAGALSIAEFNGALYVGTSTGVSVFTGSGFQTAYPFLNGQAITRLLVWGDRLLALTDGFLFSIGADNGVQQLGPTLAPPEYQQGSAFRDLAVLGDGRLVVTTTKGFAFYEPGKAWALQAPAGPNANQFLSLSVDDEGVLWSATGRDGAGVGAFGFDGAKWINYRREITPVFTSNDVFVTAPGADGSSWFGTWGYGVVHRSRAGDLTRFDADNTPGFPGIASNEKFSPISGIGTDFRGNTWFVHYLSGNGKILSCYGNDGKWRFYSCPFYPGGAIELGRVTIDQFGAKWILLPSQGLLMFDDNGTLDDLTDDTWRLLDRNSLAGLNASTLTDGLIDRLGDLWIGADLGVRTVFSPHINSNVTRTCYNTRCNIEGMYINCLAIDPVNNKWIGTKTGVFILSSDGSTILNQYNSTNSLLLDDDVRTIVIHPTTGIAYMGTNKGLSALVTPYAAANVQMSTLKILPNPFHPGRDASVSVDGLAEGSSLKILSVSGELVVEIPTPGGRVGFWDGRSATGAFVASGVYFIVAYNADGTQVAKAKVAVIRD